MLPIWISTNASNLDQSEILSFGKELRVLSPFSEMFSILTQKSSTILDRNCFAFCKMFQFGASKIRSIRYEIKVKDNVMYGIFYNF